MPRIKTTSSQATGPAKDGREAEVRDRFEQENAQERVQENLSQDQPSENTTRLKPAERDVTLTQQDDAICAMEEDVEHIPLCVFLIL
jgi:hypothetical protein